MPAVVDEALCIRHWDWSETSQTVALFARDHGVVRALAKGSRRPKSPFSGGVELLTCAEVGLIVRPQSELALLTYWDLRRTFPALRRVLAAHNAGMYIADMLLQFVRDHDPHPRLYAGAISSLDALGRCDSSPAAAGAAVGRALLEFHWALLVECGFRPELDADARTGEALEGGAEVLFHPALGGLVSAPYTPHDVAAGAWRVRSETVDLLRTLRRDGRVPARVATEPVDRANRLLASYARHVLGYQTETMSVVFGDRLVR